MKNIITLSLFFAALLTTASAQSIGESINDYLFAYELELSGQASIVLSSEIVDVPEGPTIAEEFRSRKASISTSDILVDFEGEDTDQRIFVVGDDYGGVIAIVDPENTITNVIGELSLDDGDGLRLGPVLSDGKEDSGSGKAKLTDSFAANYIIDTGKLQIFGSGLFDDKQRFSAIKNSEQRFRGKLRGDAIGNGNFVDPSKSLSFIFVIEKIKIKGSAKADITFLPAGENEG